MRYLFLSLSAVLLFGLGSCKNDKESEKTIRSMSAVIRRNSADTGYTWSAAAALVTANSPYARAVEFKGSEYGTNPTSLTMFVNNYRGAGSYNIYQGSAKQTDSNSVSLKYLGREYTSIKGSLQILRDDAELYIGRFDLIAANLNDTITINYGSFTVNKK